MPWVTRQLPGNVGNVGNPAWLGNLPGDLSLSLLKRCSKWPRQMHVQGPLNVCFKSLSPLPSLSRRCKNIFHHFSRKKRKIFAFPTHTQSEREREIYTDRSLLSTGRPRPAQNHARVRVAVRVHVRVHVGVRVGIRHPAGLSSVLSWPGRDSSCCQLSASSSRSSRRSRRRHALNEI